MERKRFKIREPFSSLSHFTGVLLGIAGLIVLLVLSHGRVKPTVAFSVYGASLITLYMVSTLYHGLNVKPNSVALLRRFDHMAIFLLIAGTYVPVCLMALHGAWRWGLLSVVYTIAAGGIAMSFWRHAPEWLRVSLYVVMGWLAVMAIPQLRLSMPPAAMGWLIAGGIVYTVGVGVFAMNRPLVRSGKFSSHDLWHIFVLAGSACHFIMMLFFI